MSPLWDTRISRACSRGSRVTRSMSRAPTRRSTSSGCSTTACFASIRGVPMIPTAIASSSRRDTVRWPTTRCSPRRGSFPPELLDGFGTFTSPLGHHPDRNLIPGVELSSGSLGHGLPIATGVALALRLQGRGDPRVVCLLATQSSTRARTTRRSRSRHGSASTGSRRWSSTTARRPTVGQAGSPSGSRSRVGATPPSPVATTTQLEQAFAANVPGRPHLVVGLVEST